MPLQVVCIPAKHRFNHLIACSDVLLQSKESLRRLKLVADGTYALTDVHAPILMHQGTAQAERWKAGHQPSTLTCEEIKQQV